jgi:hypothetical protein
MAIGALVAGAGIGGLLTYFLDPRLGGRRRALVRDQMTHARRRAADALDATAKDLSNRAEGLMAEARSRLSGDQPSDEVVAARVREKLGHYVSHTRAIDVTVSDGRVQLRGPILASEHDRLPRAIRGVRGVADVEDALEVHATADIPALQGGVPRAGQRFDLMQESWSPTTRLLVSVGGLALIASAARRARLLGTPVVAAGLAALTRAATNRTLREARDVGIQRLRGLAESPGRATGRRVEQQDEPPNTGC